MIRPKYTKEQLANYYRKQHYYNNVIRKDAIAERDIVYGTHALNAQMPKFLQRKTDDWDIFTSNAQREAKELEDKLDAAYGGDYFYTKQAQHPGTYKVESYITGKEVADYTKKPARTPYITKKNIQYVPLSWIETSAKRVLKDEASQYRWELERDTLNRIKAKNKTR